MELEMLTGIDSSRERSVASYLTFRKKTLQRNLQFLSAGWVLLVLIHTTVFTLGMI